MQEAFSQIVIRLANHVPADIELLFHFCYGDAGHKHVVEPTDMGDMVELANSLARDLPRRSNSCICRSHATGTTMPISRRCGSLSLIPKLNCALALFTTPMASKARSGVWKQPSIMLHISRLQPNAASAGAIRRQYLNCFASTPTLPMWLRMNERQNQRGMMLCEYLD